MPRQLEEMQALVTSLAVSYRVRCATALSARSSSQCAVPLQRTRFRHHTMAQDLRLYTLASSLGAWRTLYMHGTVAF